MLTTLKNFWKTLGKTISVGQQTDSLQTGCESITTNTETTCTLSDKNEIMLKHYKWIKGEKAGNVSKTNGNVITDGDVSYLEFVDGSVINLELIGEYIQYVGEFPEAKKEEPKVELLIDTPGIPLEQTDSAGPAKKEESPISLLLSTSKKKKVTIDVSIVVQCPPYELMKVLADSHDDGEAEVKRFLEWNAIDPSDVMKQVADQIWLAAYKPSKKQKQDEE